MKDLSEQLHAAHWEEILKLASDKGAEIAEILIAEILKDSGASKHTVITTAAVQLLLATHAKDSRESYNTLYAFLHDLFKGMAKIGKSLDTLH